MFIPTADFTLSDVLLPELVVQKAVLEAHRAYPFETGGLLLGTYHSDAISITVATLPGAKAKHGYTTYEPDYDYDEKIVADYYRNTGGEVVYLGDWHSHPIGAAYVSSKDRSTLRRIAKSAESRMPQPIMMIVADPRGEPELGIWQFRKRAFRLGRICPAAYTVVTRDAP